jgi:putative DNA methylase
LTRRLIEEAFPLKKVSEDSKHEKNVRHGHISTLHIWPARRPLAASRAAIIAALMPDPGDEKTRADHCRRIENITRWKSENGPDLQFFRDEIRKAYGGRAPKVLDMFAGGGAIPLEAMRLGCDVTAIDYNPVAWFILKCTLEFPQKLAGQKRPLPDFALRDRDFMEAFFKEQGFTGTKLNAQLDRLGLRETNAPMLTGLQTDASLEADLAWHVRAWGQWVLKNARRELAQFYPTYADFEPLSTEVTEWPRRERAQVALKPDGTLDIEALNAEFGAAYLKDKKQPRWVAKPAVAYLWARTVPCQDPKCGASVPLLKTLWLCNKPDKRRALRLKPNIETRVVEFELWEPGPQDEVPQGTMSGAKSCCPVCDTPLTPEYIKECGHTGKMGAQLTAVVITTDDGKQYRLPTFEDKEAARRSVDALSAAGRDIPYGLPTEPQEKNPRTLIVQLYGLDTWDQLYTSRQLLAMAVFVKHTRAARSAMGEEGYAPEWVEAISGYLALAIDRLADRASTICHWSVGFEKIQNTYSRFAVAMSWDFSEVNPLSDSSGGYLGQFEWIARFIEHALKIQQADVYPKVVRQSATQPLGSALDAIVTDPPYYNAIPYADLSDFFYVWLRRTIGDFYPENFSSPTTTKGEELALRLPHSDIPDEHTSEWYEQGMAVAFRRAHDALADDGRMVMVFAHKDPDAWETLVTAMIRVGFTVTASWPINTEMGNRTRANASAALSSSIWLVCLKRPADAPLGRYTEVKRKMQERITERLRYFWDQGISGPDFMWAAVGPALESYSTYREVRRMDGSPFTVGEFLREVRRLVADFALSRILHGASTEGLDEWTRYYLMHRSNFDLVAAPVGECILLAQGYGLDLNELKGPRGFIAKGKAKKVVEEDEIEAVDDGEEAVSESSGSSSDIRLLSFEERKRDDLGEPHPSGGLPMIDMLHRLMRLWQAGDTEKLNDYVQQYGLNQNELFWAVAQAILEMADPKTKERTLIEALVAWGRGGKPGEVQATQPAFI